MRDVAEDGDVVGWVRRVFGVPDDLVVKNLGLRESVEDGEHEDEREAGDADDDRGEMRSRDLAAEVMIDLDVGVAAHRGQWESASEIQERW